MIEISSRAASHAYGPLAQVVEQLAFNQRVAGSSPARLTSPACWHLALCQMPSLYEDKQGNQQLSLSRYGLIDTMSFQKLSE
jgi:hypothetical protein